MSSARYLRFVLGVVGVLLVLFAIVEALEVPLLTDPSEELRHAAVTSAALGVALLVADVVLPIPSSVVMTAHGALFGVAVGTILSLAGSVGAAVAGYAIGRGGAGFVERRIAPDERERADRLLDRWGVVAIVATRPVPLLAETVAMLAGVSGIGVARVALAALAGALPPALLYALAGSIADGFASTIAVFAGVTLIAAVVALVSGRAGGGDRPQGPWGRSCR